MTAWPPCIEGIGATATDAIRKHRFERLHAPKGDGPMGSEGGPKAARNSPQVAAVIVIFERFRTCRLPMPEEDDKKIGQLKVEASKGPKQLLCHMKAKPEAPANDGTCKFWVNRGRGGSAHTRSSWCHIYGSAESNDAAISRST